MIEHLKDLPPAVGGFLMAMAISILRVYFDKSETTFIRIVMESLICGFLTVCIGSGLDALGYGQNWYLFTAGVVGFMGTQWLRKVAQSLFKSRFG